MKINLVSFCIPAFLLASCMSGVTVKKVTPGSNPKGLRVNLPAPFVVGYPNPAGEIEWKIEYLPDPDEEYAVHAWSLLAKSNSAFVRTPSGMLTSATLDMDSTAVASKVAEVGGAVANKALQSAQAREDAAAQRYLTNATAIDAAKNNVAKKVREREAARKVVQDALQKQVAAQKEFDDATAANPQNPTRLAEATANLADAKTAVKTATTAFEQAVRAVELAEAELRDTRESATFDSGLAGAPKSAEDKVVGHAPSPVIFRIVEGGPEGGIGLEPVDFKVFSMNKAKVARQVEVSTWGTKPADSGQ